MAEAEPTIPAPPAARPYDALAEAKRLLRTIRAGTLATVDASGDPFASLASVATAPDGSPILLLSRLSAHTRHVEADPRCSLLLAQGGKGDPLAHPRLTLTGKARRLAEPDAMRARFLARHPKAELYVDFPDFSFWQFTIARAHLNGGFARAAAFEGAEILTDLTGRDAMVEAERSAVDHMNADHKDALRAYATALARAPDGDWRASGIDPEGIDLQSGDRTARVVFDSPVDGPGGLRKVLKDLADRARSAGPGALPAAD